MRLDRVGQRGVGGHVEAVGVRGVLGVAGHAHRQADVHLGPAGEPHVGDRADGVARAASAAASAVQPGSSTVSSSVRVSPRRGVGRQELADAPHQLAGDVVAALGADGGGDLRAGQQARQRERGRPVGGHDGELVDEPGLDVVLAEQAGDRVAGGVGAELGGAGDPLGHEVGQRVDVERLRDEARRRRRRRRAARARRAGRSPRSPGAGRSARRCAAGGTPPRR